MDKKTILIVDDAPSNLILLNNLLCRVYRVKVANSGSRGIKLALADDAPDLILLDINIPKINGFEVYRMIREDHRLDRVNVFALSASVMKEDEERIRTAGFNDFVPKPIDTKGLVKKIKDLLFV